MKYSIIFVLSALLLAQVSGAPHIEQDKHSLLYEGIDPAAYVVIGNDTYYISPTNVFFSIVEATRICNDDGLKVISFDSQEKWEMISEFMDANGYSSYEFWSSGRKTSGIFMWTSTGFEFTYTDWNEAMGQPDNTGSDICVYFDPRYGWYDEQCSQMYGFVCEF